MAPHDSDVKRRSRQIADWIDCHPRTGWYVAAWAFLVSLNALVGIADTIVKALT